MTPAGETQQLLVFRGTGAPALGWSRAPPSAPRLIPAAVSRRAKTTLQYLSPARRRSPLLYSSSASARSLLRSSRRSAAGGPPPLELGAILRLRRPLG